MNDETTPADHRWAARLAMQLLMSDIDCCNAYLEATAGQQQALNQLIARLSRAADPCKNEPL